MVNVVISSSSLSNALLCLLYHIDVFCLVSVALCCVLSCVSHGLYVPVVLCSVVVTHCVTSCGLPPVFSSVLCPFLLGLSLLVLSLTLQIGSMYSLTLCSVLSVAFFSKFFLCHLKAVFKASSVWYVPTFSSHSLAHLSKLLL